MRYAMLGLLVCGLAGLAACGTARLAPADAQLVSIAQARWPGTTVDDLKRGRDLYLGSCTACHAAEPAEEFDEATWAQIVPWMAHKSRKIATIERPAQEDLYRYIISARAAALLQPLAPADEKHPAVPGTNTTKPTSVY